MNRPQKKPRRAYLLDTNVLIHDPAALFRFAEHDVLLPMAVLEELDRLKTGINETARSARQASRKLGLLLDRVDPARIREGVALHDSVGGHSGRLYFLTADEEASARPLAADDRIIAAARATAQRRPDETVVLVSNDINLRVKCVAQGILAEDFRHDRVLDDSDTMDDGVWCVDSMLLQTASPVAGQEGVFEIRSDVCADWSPGGLLCAGDDDADDPAGDVGWLIRSCDDRRALIERCRDYRRKEDAIWGATAHSLRQNLALNLLLDPQFDLVTLSGPAGTGKTYLALAAGLQLIFEERRHTRIMVTRETVAMGEDIGFLPGSEEEKMAPWMGGIEDNLDTLIGGRDSWAGAVARDKIQARVVFRSLGFMRGRTFNDTFLIIDEAQNLSPKQMKNLVSRAGRNTRIVCLGNVNQIDSPYLTAASSGLTYLAERFRPWPHAAHVVLHGVERSRLAMAAESLL